MTGQNERMKRTLAVLLLTLACAHAAPQIPANRYGLHVVNSVALYRATVRSDHAKQLVEVAKAVPGVAIDIRYATENNFMHRQLYPIAKAYLRKPAAEALAEVQRDLATRGLGLKVFDAYRPYHITEIMWEPYKNPDFVADPAKGSRHNRGCAVDLTVVRLGSNEQLDMGTPYDAFTPAAAITYTELPVSVLENRKLLRDAMERHGFTVLPSEWWHYDFNGWQNYELLDIPLEKLP